MSDIGVSMDKDKKGFAMVIRVRVSENSKRKLVEESSRTGKPVREIAEVLLEELCSGRILASMKREISKMRCCGNCKHRGEEERCGKCEGVKLEGWELNESLLGRKEK